MEKICQRINCIKPAIYRGKYCEDHKTTKPKISKINAIVQERIKEFEEIERQTEYKQKLDEERAIRKEQDDEYELTRKLDIERLEGEEIKKIMEMSRIDYYTELKKKIDTEDIDEENCFLIRIQFPNGNKLIKKINRGSTLKNVRNYIELYKYENNINISNYDLIANFPYKRYTIKENDIDISEISDQKQFILYLQNLDN